MRLTLFNILLVLLSMPELSGQTRPDMFPVESNPTNSNFEFYTQKGGSARRASMDAVAKYISPRIEAAPIAYVPTETGNPYDDYRKFVEDPDGAIWYIDQAGRAIMIVSSPFGDDWGAQVVESDASLSGDGRAGIHVLGVALGGINSTHIAANSIDSAKICNGCVSVRDIGQHGATSGQVLKWNGTQWAASADNNSGGTVTAADEGLYLDGATAKFGAPTNSANYVSGTRYINMNGADKVVFNGTSTDRAQFDVPSDYSARLRLNNPHRATYPANADTAMVIHNFANFPTSGAATFNYALERYLIHNSNPRDTIFWGRQARIDQIATGPEYSSLYLSDGFNYDIDDNGAELSTYPYYSATKWVDLRAASYDAGYSLVTGQGSVFAEMSMTSTTTAGNIDMQSTTSIEGTVGSGKTFHFNTSGNAYLGDGTGDFTVGVNTSSPSQELDVNGDFRLRGQFYDFANSSGSNGNLLTRNASGPTWANLSVSSRLTGNGVSTALDIAQNSATTGQVLTWDGSAWSPDDPAGGGDNWGTQVVEHDATLTGFGTTINPLSWAGALSSSPVTGTGLSGSALTIAANSISTAHTDTTIDNNLLPYGTNTYTLRHNGTSWSANNYLQNTGSQIRINSALATVDTSYRLFVKQTGASTSTGGIFVQRSNATTGAAIYHNGTATFESIGGFNVGMKCAAGAIITLTPGGGAGQIRQVSISPGSNVTSVENNACILGPNATFAPTAAGGDFSIYNVEATINQTGSANGVTRGLKIAPKLTSVAVAFRGIEYVPSTQTFQYQATGSSVVNHLRGNIGVGANTTSPAAKIHAVGEGTTSATQCAVFRNSADSSIISARNDRRVGIGKESPAEALDVNGQARVDALDIRAWSGGSNTTIGQVQFEDPGSGDSEFLSLGSGERRFPLLPHMVQLQAIDYNVDWTTGRTKAFWTVPARFNNWKVSKVYIGVSSVGSTTGNTVEIERGGVGLTTQTMTQATHTITLDTTISTDDIFTFDITSVGATASKGLFVEIELRYQ